MAFSVERFVYHVFDAGALYHNSPTTLVWLLALPLVGFAFVLFRSPILSSRRRIVRVLTLSIVSVLLSFAFFYFTMLFFQSVVFSQVQWW